MIRIVLSSHFRTLLIATLIIHMIYPPSSFTSSHTPQVRAQGQDRLGHPAPTTRTIYAPIISHPEFSCAELVLNNNSPQKMIVRQNYYNKGGDPTPGQSLTLNPAEVRHVNLESLLPTNYQQRENIGGMSLTYVGGLLEVGAQLTLTGKDKRGSLDIPFSATMDYRSLVQEAVWWMPSKGIATIILGNGSDTPIQAVLKFSSGETQDVRLRPFVTEVIDYRGKGNDVRSSASDGSVESLKIEVAGPIGSLRAVGFVRASDKKVTSAIHFYDTLNARQQHLYATNLRLKDTTPHLVLRNTSGFVISATPRFLPSTGDAGSTVQLPPISLKPNQDVEVDLRPLSAAAAAKPYLQIVSIQVLSDGMNGSLIGALCAIDTITRITYDVPLRDSGPIRNSTGSYPWRLDGDYSTLISITNVGAAPAKFTVTINYRGGKYLPAIQDLAVDETIVFDLGQLQKEQIPDKDGNVIPTTAQSGQFRWSVIGGGGQSRLIGRSEVVSAALQISSSYSCPVCCPDSFSDLIPNPGSVSVPIGGSFAVYVDGLWYDCYSNPVGPYAYPYSVSWWCQNPSVASFSQVSGNQYNCNGLAVGYTDTEASTFDVVYTDDGMDCYSDYLPFYGPGSGQVYDYTITTSNQTIWPTGTGTTNVTTTTTITVQTNPVIAGQNVNVSLAEVQGAGGHINHSGTRPLGTLSSQNGTTNANGRFQTTYTSPIFGGEIAIVASVPNTGTNRGVTQGVLVSGLAALAAGNNYVLHHNDNYHPAYHFGVEAARTNLPLIASDYAMQFYPPNGQIPNADMLNFNDMSLLNGGKFELTHNWSAVASHAEHRIGINCDVRSFNVPQNRWAALRAIFQLRGSPNYLDETGTTSPHWHLRFQ